MATSVRDVSARPTPTERVQQAYRRISWTTVLLVAGIIPLSTAIRTSGAGELVAEGILKSA